MDKPLTVKVSSRNQIAVPSEARQRLNIKSGDELLVDIQDGMILLLRQPKNYASHMEGLHKEIWEKMDTSGYLGEERDAWENSTKP